MHSRFVSISATAVIIFMPIFWNNNANAADWFDGQEILVECPIWEWELSPMPNIEYELCFDDIDHCAAATIGESVCIPYLGVHDVWVTAIDTQGAEPVYYDGDIVPVMRCNSSDFDGDDIVGFSDFGIFAISFGNGSGELTDLDEDGTVGFSDFAQFASAFGKCVIESGAVYEACP